MTTTIRRPVALAAAALMLFAILVAATPSEAGHPGDNGPLFYSDGTDVYTVNSNGSGQVTTPVGKLNGFDVSPDGTKVVGAVTDDMNPIGPVVIVDLATGDKTTIHPAGVSAAFSGDGTRVAFAAEGGLYVHEVGVPGYELVDPGVNWVWDWSPVDNRVLVTRNIENPQPTLPSVSLETVDVETKATVVIEDNDDGAFTWYPSGADFSPDGTKIVYTENTPGHAQVTVEGRTNPIAETNAVSAPTGPVAWSPDGTQIAFALSTTEGEEIAVHTLASGQQTSFTADAVDLDWAPQTTATPGHDFDDVPADHVFAEDIAWLAESGITRGCNPPDNTHFCPNDNVTRGQMAAFLVRALGYTDDGGGDLFDDDNDSIFEGDIDRLATAGVTRGCNPPDNTHFCPNDNVTRGQMAAFLVRALGYTDDGGGDLFDDDNDSIFEGDIDRLATAGVTRGCNPPDNTHFCPNDYVTRGQMAAFLHRALGDR